MTEPTFTQNNLDSQYTQGYDNAMAGETGRYDSLTQTGQAGGQYDPGSDAGVVHHAAGSDAGVVHHNPSSDTGVVHYGGADQVASQVSAEAFQGGGDIQAANQSQMDNVAKVLQSGGGGEGMRLGLDAPRIGGHAEVQSYQSEPVCAGGAENVQSGGGSLFNFITNPNTGEVLSIYGNAGKALLKSYVKFFRQSGGVQAGGMAPLKDAPQGNGLLFDGMANGGAEMQPSDACQRDFGAMQSSSGTWSPNQFGGAQ